MNKLFAVTVAVVACATCLEWTRLSGTVKGINLKTETVTIQNRDGDLLVVPVDGDVKIMEKHGEKRALRTLYLDDKITLIRVPTVPEKEDTNGLVPPRYPADGQSGL